MKFVIASDIHGCYLAAEAIVRHFESYGADRILLLGDILNHGPRNGIPEHYDPLRTADMFEEYGAYVVAVRGNCDSEVDQQLLNFPLLADYAQVLADDVSLFLTHGHLPLENIERRLPLGACILTGHTHIKELRQHDAFFYVNPGSAGIPKDGTPSFALYDDGVFQLRHLYTEEVLQEMSV